MFSPIPEQLEENRATSIQVHFDPKLSGSLKTLLKLTDLPSSPPISGAVPWKLGIHLPWLAKLKQIFESDHWDVGELTRRINAWPNYVVRLKATEKEGELETIDLHFVHVKSPRTAAIPLMLLHGWPGTFWDFHKVIEPLTNPPEGHPAFDVIIPSLPGYFLSTYPQRAEWSFADSARVLHRLMTQVLGYSRYAAQGGDWGSYIMRVIGHLYPSEAPLLHFNMFRVHPPQEKDTQSFTEAEKNAIQRHIEFKESGSGYTAIQSTKPFTIGIAISTSPVALLTYIGEKMHSWSDPNTLDPLDVLDTVALYYLSQSFPTSVMIYNQSQLLKEELLDSSSSEDNRWKIGSKIGFTLFASPALASARASIKAVGPLVFYKERSVGGHFPALDNPQGLVEDVREFVGGNW
ncbi:alpha/beta-hydrolase [Hysterangium stoloniferum]|nr:alpha/beta-hydrolase [Hysterangium stoloniferum]